MTKTVGMMLLFLGLSGLAVAVEPVAPEIDLAVSSSVEKGAQCVEPCQSY